MGPDSSGAIYWLTYEVHFNTPVAPSIGLHMKCPFSLGLFRPLEAKEGRQTAGSVASDIREHRNFFSWEAAGFEPRTEETQSVTLTNTP